MSTAFGCPYSGRVDPARPVEVARRLLELGADEVCFGDTIGVGDAAQVADVTRPGARRRDPGRADRPPLPRHARARPSPTSTAALAAGVRTFDASTGGTGGCPYAPGAAGNLATEDLVYLLDEEGYEHGVDLDRLLEAARLIASLLGRPLASKVGQAGGWPVAGDAPSRAPAPPRRSPRPRPGSPAPRGRPGPARARPRARPGA